MQLLKKMWRFAGYLWEFVKYYALYPIAIWKYRGRKIYLIAERGTDARDNGYHMYRYIRQNHPELEAYYVIADQSADRPKVEVYGNVVRWKSLKHYLLFIAAEYKISTHIAGYSPNINFYTKYVGKLRWHGKKVFLQHGIIKDDLQSLYWENTRVDLFICGAKPEYDYVASAFHYKGQVKYTGLARHDALHEVELKPQVLLMPTWRMYLSKLSVDKFAKSDFVEKWNQVLRDERLIAAAKKAGIQIVFYPHYEVQKHLKLFTSTDPSVVIADFGHYDVQQLLKESQLLVTDYSSVYFDFAYMEKPCVYYQFDAEQFFAEHYSKGYFDYHTMGFGEVVQDQTQLVDYIIRYIENGFQIPQQYKNRIEGFFPLRDEQNCRRILEEIQKL